MPSVCAVGACAVACLRVAAAIEQAAQVVPGVVIESEVQRLMAAGLLRLERDGGAQACGAGWWARLLQQPSRTVKGRLVWLVTEVRST